MSTLQVISMTALTRNPAVLRPVLNAHEPMLLSQHGRAALAVIPVELLEQLLTVAEQAAALLHQPDLRQLSRSLKNFETVALLADPAALRRQLLDLTEALAREQNS